MDFSWLDIRKTEPSPVKPTILNAVIVLLSIAVVLILTSGSLWLPIRVRAFILILIAIVIFILLLKDIISIYIFGLVFTTLVNRHFLLLGRDIDFFVILICFISFLYVGQLIVNRRKVWVHTRANMFIFAFWATIIIGILNSIFFVRNVPLNALHEPLTYIIPPVAFFVIVSFVKTKSEIISIFAALFLLVFIESLYSVFTFVLSVGHKGEAVYGSLVRVMGHFGNANILAGWLEVILPVTVAFLLTSEKTRERLLILITVIAGYLTLILTFSRAGFLLGLGSLGLILLFKVKNKALTAIIIVLVVLGLIFSSGYLVRQLTVFDYEEMQMDASTIHRMLQYTNYVVTIKRYPILGIGWGARFGYSTFGAFERSVKPETRYGHLNSTMFDFGVHNGIIGIIAVYTLFVFIAYSFWRNSRIIKDKRLSLVSWCLALGILSFIAHSFVDGFLKYSNFATHLWTLVGLGFAARIVWDKYGDEVDEVGRFKFQIINPFKKFLRKPTINGN